MADKHTLLQAGAEGGLLSGPNEPVLIVRGSRAVAVAAAAPELLEALEFVTTDPCFKQLGSVTHDVVRAAITKVTGQ